MNAALFFLLPALSTVLAPPADTKSNPPALPPASQAAPAEPDLKAIARQSDVLASAASLGRKWQEHVKNGTIPDGIKLWGYTAFDGVKPDSLAESLETQTLLLGPLTRSEILEDRSLVDLNGTAPGSQGGQKGTYVTLNLLSSYEKGLRREFLVIHEPEKGGGLKITGLRREELPTGRQAAAELATGLGQLALLKLRGAPASRWEPWQHETAALAAILKLQLPAIPDSALGQDKAAGENLAAFVMAQAPPLFDSLGAAGGMHEAKAILNAFALLLLYEPGDETCTRLAVLTGVEAEKAKLPPDLWKPLLRVVSGKEKLPAVHEVVQRMAAGTAAHLAEQDLAAKIKTAPRVILDQALLNMEQLPTYHVSAELSAADGRKSTMQASLAPGAMYLQFTGFDSRKESRLVTAAGYHISTDDGKTWLPDPDAPAAQGLCRTLQAPLDRSAKVTEKHAYQLAGVEQLDGEQLFHFLCADSAPPALPEFWILLSKNGPVVRRARMSMTFGELTASALLIYTRLGKEVDIPELEPIPDK